MEYSSSIYTNVKRDRKGKQHRHFWWRELLLDKRGFELWAPTMVEGGK